MGAVVGSKLNVGFCIMVLFPQRRNFSPHCLPSHRFINEYRRHTAGVNTMMDYHPIQRGVEFCLLETVSYCLLWGAGIAQW